MEAELLTKINRARPRARLKHNNIVAMTRAFVIAAFLVLTAGCCSSEYNARVFHPWGWDDAKEFKARLAEYKNVFMVCIYEDQWQDRGPKEYSLHHLKATVVKVYKGEWRVSERI